VVFGKFTKSDKILSKIADMKKINWFELTHQKIITFNDMEIERGDILAMNSHPTHHSYTQPIEKWHMLLTLKKVWF